MSARNQPVTRRESARARFPGIGVILPVAGYDYNSDWTPLLAGLSPAGMAASLAALVRPCSGPTSERSWQGAPRQGARHAQQAQYSDRLGDRYRHRQELVPRRYRSPRRSLY